MVGSGCWIWRCLRRAQCATRTVPKAPSSYDPVTNQFKILQDYCFAPETLVATPTGQRPISEMRQGDLVLAFDHRTGIWSEQRVAKFHESIYEGPLVAITTDHGTIRGTIYHPYWVLAGRDLGERSAPRELEEHEDEGLALEGRWVNSHELRCGDVLIDRQGQRRFVVKIEQEFVSGFLVHNLTINKHHTYAVGADAILVHNTGGCPPSGNVPNPYGRLGSPAHRSTVAERAAELQRQGYTIEGGGGILPERAVQTATGRRFPDITATDQLGRPYYENIGRATGVGNPVAREIRALDNIERATGTRPVFTPYNR